MSKRTALLASLASTISDYRQGSVAAPTPNHVDRWVRQFDAGVQIQILEELDHVLKQTYITRANVESFLRTVAKTDKLTGSSPVGFWAQANFLNIQGGGRSQGEMLDMFSGTLQTEYGLDIATCGSPGGPYFYLDDAVFTGNRVKNDIATWLPSIAGQSAKLHVVVIAFHRGGQWYANSKIDEAAKQAGVHLDVTWWRCFEIEDRKAYIDNSDVLRPMSLGTDPDVQAYAANLKYPPVLRTQPTTGRNGFFSSAAARDVLEAEFLKAGMRIRRMCPYLGPYQRPLGNMVLDTLGFGALFVTFRNCPNNCPLALWAGDPWYPLFPRRTN